MCSKTIGDCLVVHQVSGEQPLSGDLGAGQLALGGERVHLLLVDLQVPGELAHAQEAGRIDSAAGRFPGAAHGASPA